MSYIQYGCGISAPENWENFDSSPTLLIQKVPIVGKCFRKEIEFPKNVKFGNIIKGLPIEYNSCNGIYCSHVLEHLSLKDFEIALRNTYKLLDENGIFRFVIPDLEFIINKYSQDTSDDAAIKFMRETHLGQEIRNYSIYSFFFDWLSNSKHLWMWDYKSIKIELENISFKNVRRAYIGDSEDKKFNEVELISRWQNCLGVECTK